MRTSAFVASVLMLAIAGCQTYRSAPLDVETHRARWSMRSPADASVRDLAIRLAESRPAAADDFDPQNGLSLAEAEATALVYNAELRVARLGAAVASAAARTAGRWEDPVFGFDGERILRSVQNPWIAAASIGITLPFSGRLGAEKRVACAEERAAIARVLADEWALRMRLRERWVTWSFQTLRVELNREFLRRLDGVIGIATRLEESGEIPRVEARVFRAERATRQIDLAAADARSREGEIEIKSLMGLVPDAPVTLLATTALEPPSEPFAIDQSLRLRALEAAYDIAEESLRLEIRKQYPDLVTAPGARAEDGDGRVTLGLELPVPLWNRNVRGIAEARARRDLARGEHEAGYELLTSQLATALRQAEAAAEQRAAVETVLIPLVDEQALDIQRIAELGQVETLVMLDTLVRGQDARMKIIEARLAEMLAIVRIQEITGPRAAGGTQ